MKMTGRAPPKAIATIHVYQLGIDDVGDRMFASD